MNAVRDISTVANSVAALRAAPAGSRGDVAVAQTDGGLWQGYVYDDVSSEPDDGRGVIKPDAVSGAGRWILKTTLESADERRSVMVVQRLAWNGQRAAVLVEDGWSLLGADATHIYLARSVDLT